MKKVAIIMGSDSDFPVVSKAVSKLKEFGVEYEVHVMSAHRTPDAAIKFSAEAKKNGFGVIIAPRSFHRPEPLRRMQLRRRSVQSPCPDGCRPARFPQPRVLTSTQ